MKKITVTIWCLIFSFIFTGWRSRLNGSEGSESQWQWQVDDLLTTDQIDEYRLSADGKKLAWTISQWNVKEQKRYNILYLTPLEGEKKEELKKIRLTRGEDTIDSIQWVPGENKISFKTGRKFKDTKPGNLWVMNLNGGEPYPLTSFAAGVRQYKWLDKDNLLFVGREEKSLYENEIKEKKDTFEVIEDEEHRVITRLFTYNLESKKTKRLTDNMKPLRSFTVSRNKKWVIYSISMSIRYMVDEEIKPKFYLMNLETGESTEIFADPQWKPAGFRWAVDDSGFYVGMSYSTHPRYIMANVIKIYWYPLDTGEYKEVDLGWERYGENPVPTSNGFIIALLDGVHYKYARYYKKGDTWKRQWIKGDMQKNIQSIHLAEDGKTMIYTYSTASLPQRYYLSELKGNQFNKTAEVMDIESPFFKKPLARTEIITWKGARNDTIEGILNYPCHYQEGKKYPLIVMIHGGPFGADMDFFTASFSRPIHLLSERGTFILRVNYHGSSNYGLEFGESIAGHYYEYEIPDIENGVDYLISQGKVDKDKLGIMGWSNGAILGTALTLHANRYKAASLGAGDVNWTSDYGNCSFGVAFDNYYFGGPPWEKVEEYIKLSPLFQLQKVTTPTLIFHGTKDRAVPYAQSWEYYRALQQIGKVPVRFISFPGEGHGPRKLAHQRRKLSEDLQWFEKYLFKTDKPKNPSLKKGSPLEHFLKTAKVNGWYGIEKQGVLVPELVKYKKINVGRFEVTRAQWAAFDKNFQFDKDTGNYPVTGITFEQAGKYIGWLNQTTGESYRLPKKDEVKTLYAKRSGNTFDYWAGYTLNPEDYKNLQEELKKFPDKPVLLKPAGSFKGMGDNPVFDLGGNAAEWVEIEAGKGKACGGSAERPHDDKSEIQPQSRYIGFRVVKE
jgi:dipeptidyl aminopeptidase/acylaminoacyl peptidase